ncbi:MAG TPA: hypothetical protein PKY82_21210 [Pyrinomonadaceae bacterium]|nr:hypothetical protein [Pyrinomonadaceae bacterium]
MIDQEKRKSFVNYLHKLAEGDGFSEDWKKFIIEHYLDEHLESIRRNIVRLRVKAGDPIIFPVNDEQRKQLLNWAKELL